MTATARRPRRRASDVGVNRTTATDNNNLYICFENWSIGVTLPGCPPPSTPPPPPPPSPPTLLSCIIHRPAAAARTSLRSPRSPGQDTPHSHILNADFPLFFFLCGQRSLKAPMITSCSPVFGTQPNRAKYTQLKTRPLPGIQISH